MSVFTTVTTMSNLDKTPQIKHLDSLQYNRYLQKLSVSGYNVPDPFSLECVDDISRWPEVLFGNIWGYFINTPGMYTNDKLLSYKSLESYDFFHCGHVHAIVYHAVEKNSPVCVLRTRVTRSQAQNDPPHYAWATVYKKTGEISAAHCTCMAGLGESCSHVAAMLFKVEAAYRMNLHKSCTDAAAAWNNNFKKKVTPAEIDNMDFSNETHHERKRQKRLKAGLKGTPQKRQFKQAAFAEIQPESYDDKNDRLKKLWDISKGSAVFSTFNKGAFRDAEDTETASEDETPCFVNIPLPITLTALFRPEYKEYEPRELKEEGRKLYAGVVLKDTTESLKLVEDNTRLQSKTPVWHAYRAGRITASKVHDILTLKPATCPTNLIKRILGYGGHFTTPYTQWGLDMETTALETYKKQIQAYHRTMSLTNVGLNICQQLPFLGASVDGIRACECHPDTLVEVKCPYKHKQVDPHTLLGTTGFCIDIHGNLKQNHRYYSQVWLQMFVLEKDACDFVIYTERGIFVTSVQMNVDFCNDMVAKSTLFFFNHIMPEILSKTIERTLPSPQTSKSTICFCEKPAKGRMITCADIKCSVKKFHYVCIGITRKPKEVNWFCPVCVRITDI